MFSSVSRVFAANPSCKQTFLKTQNAARVSLENLANQFNYSLPVIERISKYQPQVYAEMIKIHLGKKSRYSVNDLTGVDLYRGLVSAPEDYDPLFTLNQFGGTREGINWFSKDSSKAHNYATPSREQAIEKKYETKKSIVPMGMLIHFQIPQFIVEEANVNFKPKDKNLALDRKFLGNESLYIDGLTIISADFNINDFTEKELSYEAFVKKYLGKSPRRKSFIF